MKEASFLSFQVNNQ